MKIKTDETGKIISFDIDLLINKNGNGILYKGELIDNNLSFKKLNILLDANVYHSYQNVTEEAFENLESINFISLYSFANDYELTRNRNIEKNIILLEFSYETFFDHNPIFDSFIIDNNNYSAVKIDDEFNIAHQIKLSYVQEENNNFPIFNIAFYSQIS